MNCTDFQFNSGTYRNNSSSGTKTDSGFHRPDVEVFFSYTFELAPFFDDLDKILAKDEKERAGLFHFNEDRATYKACHAMLRLLLSKKTGTDPSELVFLKEENNKPGIENSRIRFNITHTRDAFGIAFSENDYIGIDIEKLNRHSDVTSLTNTYFSDSDRDFISGSAYGAAERFILLWTRKEALLKAVGIGIITDLKKISVYTDGTPSMIENLNGFQNSISCENHFIYSGQVEDHMISVAVPHESNIIFRHLRGENLKSYIQIPGVVICK